MFFFFVRCVGVVYVEVYLDFGVDADVGVYVHVRKHVDLIRNVLVCLSIVVVDIQLNVDVVVEVRVVCVRFVFVVDIGVDIDIDVDVF